MNFTQQIAKHLREVYFGGNWTSVNLKDTIADVTWQEATTQIHSLNTIATLIYHTHYYVHVVSKFLQGEKLNAKDEYSFNLPPVQSQEDWENLLNETWADVEVLAAQIEDLPDDQLEEIFADEKYGSYYRNFHGIVEHTHYHLGQIVLIKKMLRLGEKAQNVFTE